MLINYENKSANMPLNTLYKFSASESTELWRYINLSIIIIIIIIRWYL